MSNLFLAEKWQHCVCASLWKSFKHFLPNFPSKQTRERRTYSTFSFCILLSRISDKHFLFCAVPTAACCCWRCRLLLLLLPFSIMYECAAGIGQQTSKSATTEKFLYTVFNGHTENCTRNIVNQTRKQVENRKLKRLEKNNQEKSVKIFLKIFYTTNFYNCPKDAIAGEKKEKKQNKNRIASQFSQKKTSI